jgi:uncharacterized LabA/DUF88 family protein
MKTFVYVDGFNLYYGAVKGTPYKWLDISRLCQLLLPRNQIIKIKYFTALVTARPGDPAQPNRQQLYLRALRTIPNLEVTLGHFLAHTVSMPLALPQAGAPRFATVIKTEEKGSDVNIAAHMVNDCHRGLFEVAVLVSNDSDLVEPLKIVRHELGFPVGILNPFPAKASHELRRHATFMKPIRPGALGASQFPPFLTDNAGTFHKPAAW